MLSSAMIYGKDLYKKIIDDLPAALERYGFSSIEDVKSSKLSKGSVKFEPCYPQIDDSKCTRCGLCEKVCPYFAMKVDKNARADEEKCFGCGLCQSRCPVHAISRVY